MAYMTFTDALMQAKRASTLRGTPFTATDTSNLQSAYMSGAAERAGAGRSAALAEQSLAGQKKNFADTLAQEKEISAASLTQQKGLSESSLAQTKTLSDADLAQGKAISEANLLQGKTLSDTTLAQTRQLAADKIAADKVIEDNRLAREKEAQETALAQEKELALLTEAQAREDIQKQIDAQDAAATKALYGNVVNTAATGSLVYALMPSAAPTTAAGAAGAAGAEAGAGAATTLGTTTPVLPYLGPAVAGYVAPDVVNAIHEDTTENLGHNTTLGLVQDEGTADFIGSVEAGAAAGATVGAFVPIPGAPVAGAVIGGTLGGIRQIVSDCCFIFVEAYSGLLPIVRRYRDEHMTDKNRRGYYRIADKIVPMMQKSKAFKWAVRIVMTGPMVSYGKYFYGVGKIGIIFAPVAKMWLKIFDLLGSGTYTRKNGEKI